MERPREATIVCCVVKGRCMKDGIAYQIQMGGKTGHDLPKQDIVITR